MVQGICRMLCVWNQTGHRRRRLLLEVIIENRNVVLYAVHFLFFGLIAMDSICCSFRGRPKRYFAISLAVIPPTNWWYKCSQNPMRISLSEFDCE